MGFVVEEWLEFVIDNLVGDCMGLMENFCFFVDEFEKMLEGFWVM